MALEQLVKRRDKWRELQNRAARSGGLEARPGRGDRLARRTLMERKDRRREPGDGTRPKLKPQSQTSP